MSTIEEAREQAREALPGALARLVENRLGKSLAREADKDMIALRAAANAIVALLDATEPPAHDEGCEADWGPEGQESPCRCATPTDRPAEDEREALVMTLYANGMAGNLHEPIRRQAVEKWADAILADGYSKGPRPITDEGEREAAELEADRRWPSPNSGLYEGLRIGFQKGAEWANGPRPITDEMVEAVTRTLDAHRWKTMGTNTVECECGDIITGDEDSMLQAFPADEAFRKHIARAALEAAEEARQ